MSHRVFGQLNAGTAPGVAPGMVRLYDAEQPDGCPVHVWEGTPMEARTLARSLNLCAAWAEWVVTHSCQRRRLSGVRSGA
jgi:hypothetical protein